MLWVALIGTVAATTWTALLWSHTHDPIRVYYGSDVAATPLMLGAAVAGVYASVAWTPALRRWTGLLGAIGFGVMIVGLFKAFPPNVQFMGAQSALEVGTALAILGLVTAPVALIERGLTLTPVVLLGRISYGTYLWQGPVIMLLIAHTALRSWSLLAAGLAGTLLLSGASYIIVERRFLELKKRIRRPPARVPEAHRT